MTDYSTEESFNEESQHNGNKEISAQTVPVIAQTEGVWHPWMQQIVQQQFEVMPTYTILLRRWWHDIAAKNHSSILKQKKHWTVFLRLNRCLSICKPN